MLVAYSSSMKSRNVFPLLILLLLASLLISCSSTSSSNSGNSGGTQPPPPPPVSYTIGGTVTSLAGSGGGLQLQDNGGDTLSVNANGSFTFATKLESGKSYNVTVYQQPSSPKQTCEVTNGTGTATGNVTDIAVDCGHNEWTWTSGSNAANQTATYGAQGAPSSGNIPGGRGSAVSWTDTSANFWLFGGLACDSTGTLGDVNDLWKYSNGQWTWMSGANIADQPGAYGTQGTASAGSTPGARESAVTWIDGSGNLWLFGGYGYDSVGTGGLLNDLWKYSSGEWTWMSGSNLANQPGTYGMQGAAASGNVPGARFNSVAWTDASGNFWLFGGQGDDSAGTQGDLNDLWEYSGGQWTWVNGANVANQAGTYGTEGTAASGNTPGARESAVTWTDKSGNLWLFGGYGYDSTATQGLLNDLWKYSGGQWAWASGANIAEQSGIYGSQGSAASGNIPGARADAIGWTDGSGNFWLFGGVGYDSAGTGGALNDLWKFTGGQWTWVGGANVVQQSGSYGTQGTAAPGNIPGARYSSVTWTDSSGNLWLFGGQGYDSTGTIGWLNDLWSYRP